MCNIQHVTKVNQTNICNTSKVNVHIKRKLTTKKERKTNIHNKQINATCKTHRRTTNLGKNAETYKYANKTYTPTLCDY